MGARTPLPSPLPCSSSCSAVTRISAPSPATFVRLHSDSESHDSIRLRRLCVTAESGSLTRLCVQIINWGPPGSLQMYFQMVGRGGRDMQPARCLLVWSRANVATKRFLQRQDAARCVRLRYRLSRCCAPNVYRRSQTPVARTGARPPVQERRHVNGCRGL